MKNIFTIIKKELKRIFTDKRMLAGLILPGLFIYLIYSIMGDTLMTRFTPNNDYEYRVVVFNEPESMTNVINADEYKVKLVDEYSTVELAKTALSENKIDILIVFDENFDENYGSEQPENIPNVSIYYNSSSTESSLIYSYFTSVFSTLSANVSYNFFVNRLGDTYDLATKEDTSAKIIQMIVPLLLIVFLFSGSMAVATESIAGEKERGTIATLLVTPVKRSDIALGKVVALSIAGMVSSLTSFLGVIFSFPKLMGGAENEITLTMYDFATYIEIFALMIITVMFFTVIISIISTFAKSVKEASQYAVPVMVIIMMLSFPSMLGSSITQAYFVYFIPVLNIIQTMSSIFSLSFNLLNFVTAIVSTAVYTGLGVYILTKMFNSERVMFNK